MKIKIPEDVGLVGTSDAFRYEQACAYVDENQALVGSAAIDLVVAQLHRNERGVPTDPIDLFIPGKWQEGNSLRSDLP